MLESFLNLFRRPVVRRQSSVVGLSTNGTRPEALSGGVRETDSTFYPGSNMSSLYRDRYDYDRQTILAECLRAWRVNPIARRIVKLISMFVVGEGITVQSDHKSTSAFLNLWWNHPLNRLGRNCISFCDEATRSGNLFFLCTVDQSNGMLYVRAVPADQIEEIVTAPNDVQQELAYKPVKQGAPLWPSYLAVKHEQLTDDGPQTMDHGQPSIVHLPSSPFMLHYAYNQPVGVAWGEPDLAPMLSWIGRYSAWLEDRARLNRFRFSWLFVWKKKWESEAAKLAKSRELASNPPPSGSWFLLDENETLEMPAPNLESGDAEKDGLALKKMIAIGAGVPTHYLAEPESSTRTTAEAAGTPTFRGLEQTQQFFLDILTEIAVIAVEQRKKFDRRVNPGSRIVAAGPDITERDNSSLALAVSRVYPAMSEIFDRGGIDETELLRMVYRMAGEARPPDETPPMLKRPLSSPRSGGKPAAPGPQKTGKTGLPAGSQSQKDAAAEPTDIPEDVQP